MSSWVDFAIILLLILPFYFILVLPFKGILLGKRRLSISLLVCLAGTVLLIFVGSGGQGPILDDNLTLRYHLAIFTLLSGLFFLYTNVRAQFCKLLLSLFLCKCYLDFLFIFTLLLRRVFFNIGFLVEPITSSIFTILFLSLLILPTIIYYMQNLLRPLLQEQQNAGYWSRLWLIPALFYFFFALLTITSNIHSSLNNTMLPERTTSYIIWFLGTFMSCGILMQLLLKDGRSTLLKERLRLSNLHLLMQRKEYQRLQELIETTRRQRHDMRQQLKVIQGLAKQGADQSILDYVNKFLQISRLENGTTLCENYAVNALMQYYVAQCRAEHIVANITLNLPYQLPLPEADVAAILGNLVENALDACKSQQQGHRFLNVKADLISGQMLALTVRNSYDTEIIRSGELFISSKRPNHQEGIGITSVRSIAANYQGVTKFTYAHHIFQASVLLNGNTKQDV